MRLKQIKLAGFKSFVDITNVPFPQNMTAIVGPNGCGKSNIIDAVRWVLGESSAKNLRGDSMTDVIFNGSTERKPVGQASVELIFDNNDYRIQGSMADRSEISIRRLVTRDAVNTYYLNGSKCRRKDITDIFLGTGLGPRSYAIIEQGMISRLIESKPQELRIFIEEAAGVSKYKERRRETENRIKHTRENLLRLADIRQELTIQIEKLHGQSIAASRFKGLKAKERTLKAQLVVLKWQLYQQKIEKITVKANKVELSIERLVTEQGANELKQVNAQHRFRQANIDLAKCQQKKLTVNTDITRLEQNIKHAKQQQLTLNQELQRNDEQRRSVNEHIETQQHNMLLAQQQIDQHSPHFSQLSQTSTRLEEQYQQRLTQQSNWQQQWDSYQQEYAAFRQKLKVNATQITSIMDLMDKSGQRIDEVNNQLTNIPLGALIEEKMVVEQKIEEHQYQLDSLQDAQHEQRLLVQKNELLLTDLAHQKIDINNELLAVSAKHSAFAETLSQQQGWQSKQRELLTAQGILIQDELIKHIKVNPGWELAVEVVLGQWLNALQVNSFADVGQMDIALLVKPSCNISPVQGTLNEQVTTAHPFSELLNSIYVVSSPEQAQQFCLGNQEKLEHGASVICPEGHWYGKDWMKKGSIEIQSGQIKRIKQVQQLANQMQTLEQKLAALEHKHEKHGVVTRSANTELTQLVDATQSLSQQILLLKQDASLHDQEVKFKQEQQQQLHLELAQTNDLLANEQKRLSVLTAEKTQLQGAEGAFVSLKEELQRERTQLEQVISALNTEKTECTARLHQLNLQIEKARSSLISIEQTLARESAQLETLLLRQDELKFSQEDELLPIIEQEEQLQSLLTKSLSIENQLNDVNKQLATENEQMSSINVVQHRILNDIEAQKETLSQYKVESETYHVRVNTCLEQLAEMQQSLADLLEHLPAQAKESQWQLQLLKISKEISSLGAINLAAIEEYETQYQRKEYLDKQNTDLETALNTLENAIHKIDNESRIKFKTTFEQVNSDLKELFPKVFGGGNAYLDLTSDDLLETGVTIMARPPGKKNSTIHLLSGGEKALTALSLVFAIFRLNPAPFCMLDEVDAPLDDANVGRFCNLVKEMSQTVQFIYISHNKIAMEMASHLTGVTMFEPGVSRMVAVDIDEAIAMADVS